jgi:hypothetical protein
MDRVLFVDDFWDCPRKGFTEYKGRLYYFTCGWDLDEDDYSSVYELVPVGKATLDLALELHAIWLVWESDFRNGRASHDANPAQGGVNAQYDELIRRHKDALAALPPANLRATARFGWAPGDETILVNTRPWLVTWSELPADGVVVK